MDTYSEMPKSKKIKNFLYILLILLIGIGSAFGIYKYSSRDKDSTNLIPSDRGISLVDKTNIENKEPPKPVFIASPINGVMLEDKDFNRLKERPVLAVMIQNHSLSRPQWGLNQADVVYEALAEGGITRFMGIFWSQDAAKIMSVRSSRKYYVDLTGDYKNPVYMHIGYADGDSSVSAIKAINQYGVRSLGLSGNGSFYRDQACQRIKAIEHCAYTDTKTLWTNAANLGWSQDISALETWKYKDENYKVDTTSKELTDFTTSFGSAESALYDTRWKYDANSNRYNRFNPDGTPFMDGEGKQITSDVVIFQKVNSAGTGDIKNHIVQDVIGSGTGYIMQDGRVYPVTWKKPNYSTKTRFYSAGTGEEFVFGRGRIWVMIVPKNLDYKDNAPKPTTTQANG